MMPSRQDRRRSRVATRGTVSGIGVARNSHSTGESTLRVDRIVVGGLARTDGEAFAKALDRELVARLRDSQSRSGGARTVARIDAGVVEVSERDRVTAVAERLAVCIVEGLER